jgi:epoxyqueuosine reductase
MNFKNNNNHSSLLKRNIQLWSKELGFAAVGITGTDISSEKSRFLFYLENHFNGEMNYLQKNLEKRLLPENLFPPVKSIISCYINYSPLKKDHFISSYAVRSDYHKVIKKQLKKLAHKIENSIGKFNYRIFCGSAPVLEKALAKNAGLGWIGKNTLLINSSAGSFLFLGEIYTDLNLPYDYPVKDRCGNCQKCINACPTKALVAPYILDARKCISYLTIEHKTKIPEEIRKKISNQIFGCDICQKVCPWNRFAKSTENPVLSTLPHLKNLTLEEIKSWNEKTFFEQTAGTPLRRISYEQFKRNIDSSYKFI